MDIIASRLKWLREKNNYGQKEVAAKIGISTSGYQKMELGLSKPKIETLKSLCELYGETSDFIIGLSDHDSKVRKSYQEIKIYEHMVKATFEEMYDKYLKDKIDENRKKQLEKDFEMYKVITEDCINDYLVKLLDIPQIDIKKDEYYKEKYPISVQIEEIHNHDCWTVNLLDKNNEAFTSAAIVEKKNEAEQLAIFYEKKHGIPYKFNN